MSTLGFGVLVLSGCNSSSPPDTNTSTTTTTSSTKTTGSTSTSSTDTAPPDTTAADAAAAPKRKPPAGMGNAIGRVLFDSKPAANIEATLCEDIGIVGGCSGQKYMGKTDKDGYYVIDKVKPGEYALMVRVFNTNGVIYPTAGVMSAAKFKVEKDESLAVRTVNLWKTDLQVAAPKNGDTVKTGKPTFSWKAYPSAANYKVSLRTKDGAGISETIETSKTSATAEKALLNGDYQWRVEATNADGVKIAETAKDAVFKVTGQAGSNKVELVNPKANSSVGGANLTLQWKAHPQATEYRVYLKGVKAEKSLLSFESMSGTSHKLAAPLPADQYFWQVDAYNGSDKVAGSALERFTVK